MVRKLVVCRKCHTACPPDDGKCWMCGAAMVTAKRYSPTTYSLTSAFLVTTLIAIGCGIAVSAPGLAILMAIVATPALIRTVVLVERRKERGIATNEKIAMFFGYVGVALLAGFAGIVAFFGFCFVACFGIIGLEWGIGSGGMPESGGMQFLTSLSCVLAVGLGFVVFIYLNIKLGAKE
jgi:hypothetical protein